MSDSFAAVLRRDYLDLIESMAAGVEGKVIRCADYRHWQGWKQEHQRTDWLYQPLRQIYKDLMGLFSIPVIRAANDLLIDLGWLSRRENPGNGQDKTYQYNVRFDRLTQLLAEIRSASSFEQTDVSGESPDVSASSVNTHHKFISTYMNCSALLCEDGVSRTPTHLQFVLLTLLLGNLPSKSGEAHQVEVPYRRLKTLVPNAFEPIFIWLRYLVGSSLLTKFRGLLTGYWALLRVSIWVRQLPTGRPVTFLCTGCRPHARSGSVTVVPRFPNCITDCWRHNPRAPLTPSCYARKGNAWRLMFKSSLFQREKNDTSFEPELEVFLLLRRADQSTSAIGEVL